MRDDRTASRRQMLVGLLLFTLGSLFGNLLLSRGFCRLQGPVRQKNSCRNGDREPVTVSPPAKQLLQRLHVTVTHAWKVEKLGWLQQVLGEIASYQSTVRVVVICNQGPRLKTHMGSVSWRVRTQDVVVHHCGEEFDDPFKLGWVHRTYIAEVIYKDDSWTCFMHISDDMLVPWPSVVAWAEDALTLERLGLQRGFVRVEIMPFTGESSIVDQRLEEGPILLNSSAARLVHINSRGARDTAENSVHHYINLPNPFQGMWVASRAQLAKYMASPLWDLDSALSYDNRPWGGDIPEMAECGVLWVDTPEGFESAAVVPYNPVTKQLLEVAMVHHLPNRQCSRKPVEYPPIKEDDPYACWFTPDNFLV